jgi:hypothetical protein
MKNHLFMIHRAIEPLVYDIQHVIFDIIINKCDYLFENFKNTVIAEIESRKLPPVIKYTIESADICNVWKYKPPNNNIKIMCIELMFYDWEKSFNIRFNSETTATICRGLHGHNYPNRHKLEVRLSHVNDLMMPMMLNQYIDTTYIIQQVDMRDYSIVPSQNKQKRARNWARKLESRRIKKAAKAINANQSLDFPAETCPVRTALSEPETI